MKWGPTSVNSNPARIVFLRTPETKQRLLPALAPGNVDKMMTASVTAIIGYDAKFYELLPKLFPGTAARGEFDQKYFPDSHIKTNFICNLGYGDPAKLFPRSPRLDFDEACQML